MCQKKYDKIKTQISFKELKIETIDSKLKEYFDAKDDKKSVVLKEIKDQLKLDDLNLTYFLSLYKKYRFKGQSEKDNKIIKIYEKEMQAKDCLVVFPTAIATKQQMKHLPHKQYDQLLEEYDGKDAKKAALWIKKMQAGTGSSMKRDAYLKKLLKISSDNVKIGSKGTDLYIETPEKKLINLAEVQILQSIVDANEGKFGEVILHNIVSDETKDSIDGLWNKKSYLDNNMSYIEFVKESANLYLNQETMQFHIPTINENDEITFNRKAPGGHGLFGLDALRACYIDELRPKTDRVLIGSIGNGEDLGSSPDEYMVSWMAKEQIPIAMVTTTKTNIDLKGGQISLIKNNDDSYYVSMIEKAQAEQSDQVKLFYELGLRESDSDAFFNTNMVLINYDVLVPKIKKLIKEIGEEAFLEKITPDLIENIKSQKDSDGEDRNYRQLEGALGSVILNLGKFWQEHYKESLVHILNVSKEKRTHFFSPVKNGFDFFMQFHSDRFKFNFKTFRLEDQRPGELPYVDLKDSHYKEVQNVLDSFEGSKILKLDSLNVEGVEKFQNKELKGKVNC